MKKSLLVLGLAACMAVPVMAQNADTVYQKREVIIIDEDPPADRGAVNDYREIIIQNTTRHRGYNSSARRNTYPRDRFDFVTTIGLGYNGLVGDLGSLKLPQDAKFMSLETKSINFNLMLVRYRVMFSHVFNLQTGLELEVNNFRFEENMILGLDAAGNIAPNESYQEAGIHLEKSKLVSSYFNIPLVVRINFDRRESSYLYGGMVGGWRWNSYQKIKSSETGKDRIRENLELRNFHYGYTAGVVFKNVGVYATYYPHSIFKAGTDPHVRQVNVGLQFSW